MYIFFKNPIYFGYFTEIYLQMPIPTQAKIVKKGSAGPDQFELSIAQALLELENNSDLKAQLRELYITKAKEIELLGKKVCFIAYKIYSG